MESHSELAKLLTEKELRDALLLIFANKQVRERDLRMILTSLWEREMYKYAHFTLHSKGVNTDDFTSKL